MRRFSKSVPLFVSLAVIFAITLVPAQSRVVQAQGNHIVYNIYATDGYVAMADGTRVYIYGFIGGREGEPLNWQDRNGVWQTLPTGAPAPTAGPIAGGEAALAGNAQLPGPVIYAAVGDVVEIRLKNLGVTVKSAPNDPHTIHLHGMDVDAANDGVPETSVAAVPANAPDQGAGNVVVYMFKPEIAGTYLYHCHQEANIHVQMGMYGALVVYNPGDPAYLNGGPGKGSGGNLWGHNYTKDYILLLSEFDLGQHKAEERAGAAGGYNSVNFRPQYWFINGLGFPQTIHAGIIWGDPNITDCVANPGCGWINAHPGYDPFIVGSVGTAGPPDDVLLRVINIGFQTHPMHMHGYHAEIIGSDQRHWPWADTGTQIYDGLEKNTLTVGSGETYEWIIHFGEQTLFNWYPPQTTDVHGDPLGDDWFGGGTQSKADPLTGAPLSNLDAAGVPIVDPFVAPKTYIGGPAVGPIEPGDAGSEAAFLAGGLIQGQLFPFHNHDDYKATNNGVYPGGMFTMIMTLP